MWESTLNDRYSSSVTPSIILPTTEAQIVSFIKFIVVELITKHLSYEKTLTCSIKDTICDNNNSNDMYLSRKSQLGPNLMLNNLEVGEYYFSKIHHSSLNSPNQI